MISLESKAARFIAKLQGGERESRFLRKLAARSKVYVDMYSYGGCFRSCFNNGGAVTVGRYCSFADGVRYYGANHPLSKVALSPYFYNSEWAGQQVDDIPRCKLSIGNDVWIGSGVIITAGCENIGNGAVIGAGSVVTRDVASYSVVGGSPARLLKMRFSVPEQEAIERSRWWELDPTTVLRFYELMDDPFAFSEAICKARSRVQL